MVVDDASDVAALSQELGYHVTTAQARERISAQTDDGVALVAVADGRVVGWIQGLNRELLIYPRVLEVGGLIVVDSHRGTGIGRALLKALTEWGSERGHTQIFVRSSSAREVAHRFYERLGLERQKTSHTFLIEIQ